MKTGLDYVIFQNYLQAEQSVSNDNNIDHHSNSYHLLNDRYESW